MSILAKRVVLVLAVLTCAGATLRFQRTVTETGGGAPSQKTWRVLWPGQNGRVKMQHDGKLKTDDYAAYGLVWVGGFFEEQQTIVNY